jgi:O-antigen ligase
MSYSSPDNIFKPAYSSHFTLLFSALIGMLAITIQLQYDIQIGNIYARIGISDFIYPFVFFLYMWTRNFIIPGKDFKKYILWISASFLIITISTVIEYSNFGNLNSWGIKKLLGWPLLIGYLVTGCLIGGISKGRDYFIRAMIIGYSLIAGLQVLLYLIDTSFLLLTPYNGWRLRGFLENPNAYGFLGVCVIAFQLAYYDSALLSTFTKRTCIILSTLAIIFTGSKSAMASYIALLLVFLVIKPISLKTVKWVVISFIAALVLMLSSSYLNKIMENESSKFYKDFEYNLRGAYFYSLKENKGILERLKINHLALENWKKAPIFGNGLGSFVEIQKSENASEPMTVHNTFLWIMSEMGIIGLCIFLLFPLMLLRSAWSEIKIINNHQPIALATIGLLSATGVASMFNEFMYQRHVWLLLGVYIGSSQALSLVKKE